MKIGAARGVRVGLKILVPLVTVAISVGAAKWLIDSKPPPPQRPVEETRPAVLAAQIRRSTVCFPIRSQGTVTARTEATLIARVSGRVIRVADSFDESGFFQEGDELLEIDPRDYQVRIDRLQASLDAAEARQKEASQHLERQKELETRNATSQEILDRAKAALDVSTAQLAEFREQMKEARNAFDDRVVIAPFDGCIREKQADVGQYVTAGTLLATCFATDTVEVRLPLNDSEFAFLDLPLGAALPPGVRPEVTLTTQFAGRVCWWKGEIVRTEAIVDSRSRMVYLVASVDSPYGAAARDHNDGQPLALGMYVEASIRSAPVADVAVLPEACVDVGDSVLLIDGDGKLRSHEVQVLRRDGEWVVVRCDLAEGQYVCATRLEQAVEQMQIRVVEEVAAELAAADNGAADLSAGVTLATRPYVHQRARK